jgi:hypothetical protein
MLRKLLISKLHADVINIIEIELTKLYKKDLLNELMSKVHHSYSSVWINTHLITINYKTTIYYPTLIKTFYKGHRFGEWTEMTQWYDDLGVIYQRYFNHIRDRLFYLP